MRVIFCVLAMAIAANAYSDAIEAEPTNDDAATPASDTHTKSNSMSGHEQGIIYGLNIGIPVGLVFAFASKNRKSTA